jgi:redox-sensitive bicupin YhaK (pirin superfamily)
VRDGWVRDGRSAVASAPAASHHEPPAHHPVEGVVVVVGVQVLVRGIAPGYEQLDIASSLDAGGLVVVASGMPRHTHESAISIRQEHAALYATRLAPGASATSPVAPLAHLFVARGSVELEGAGVLGTGAAARITGADGQRVTAGPDGAEVLIWEMHATLS